MKTIIAGSRGVNKAQAVADAIQASGFNIATVISGTARGADRLGEQWAAKNNIPVERYPALWDVEGRSAGYRRNERMADVAEALIAIWDGESRGTKHMIDIAKQRGLKVYVHKA